jgi:ABC-type bacteriocin/lantibiotic exporter with double-glycine peptidase domain
MHYLFFTTILVQLTYVAGYLLIVAVCLLPVACCWSLVACFVFSDKNLTKIFYFRRLEEAGSLKTEDGSQKKTKFR